MLAALRRERKLFARHTIMCKFTRKFTQQRDYPGLKRQNRL